MEQDRSNVGKRDLGDRVEDNWDRFKGRVREKWNDLTDRDLDSYKGRRKDELVGHISERTGEQREAIGRDVDSLSRDTGYRFD